MNRICRTIRQRAAEHGAGAVTGDARVDAHLTDCTACRRALDTLTELDAVLGTLPLHDASDPVVDALLARVAVEPVVEAHADSAPRGVRGSRFGARFRGWIDQPRRRRGLAMAALVAVTVAVGLQLRVSHHDLAEPSRVSAPTSTGPALATEVDGAFVPDAVAMGSVSTGSTVSAEELEKIPTSRDPWAALNTVPGVEVDRISAGDEKKEQAPGREVVEQKRKQLNESMRALPPAQRPVPPPPPPPSFEPKAGDEGPPAAPKASVLDRYRRGARVPPRSVAPDPQIESLEESIELEVATAPVPPPARAGVGSDDAARSSERPGTAPAAVDEDPGSAERNEQQAKAIAEQEAAGMITEEQADLAWNVDGVSVVDMGAVGASPSYPVFEDEIAGGDLARAFLAARGRSQGLTFQDPQGYWSNTYVPGDAALRWVTARLARHAPWIATADAETGPRLHDAARPPTRPFDPPRNAAMALYLDSDRATMTGPGRALVQVGLRATDRHPGQRPALDLALVVDLEDRPSDSSTESMRALLRAVVESVEPGDRVHVFFAGTPVPPIDPSSFRHGTVQIALADALAARSATDGSTPPGLSTTLHGATEQLAAARDELGATALVLVTGRADVTPFRAWAHRSAMAGAPVTVVGVGEAVDRTSMTDLALAGQGRVRHLVHPAEAAAVVADELEAVSRVVARALRLHIRLASGVSLVEVIGAERLDGTAIAQVREAEQRMDQRLARERGIASDRGEDDDGIQIVIPAFHAGDSHVVLLDVVTSGPGRVADVTLRYKDLVRAKNGTARARLKLRRGQPARDEADRQRARAVIKNLLAHETRAVLIGAAETLKTAPETSRANLTRLHALLASFRDLDGGWAGDRDVAADVAMVADYLEHIAAVSDPDSAIVDLLADSMRLAGGRKIVITPPVASTEPWTNQGSDG